MPAGPVEPETVWDDPPVVAFTAPNPGPKTLEGTRAYVIGTDPAYIVDPGPDIPEYLQSVAGWLEATGRAATGILLTHGHPDHAAGAAALSGPLRAPVWAAASDPYPLRDVPPHRDYGTGRCFSLGGQDTLSVIPSPGHTPDSVVLWLERPRILFSGDTILGHGTSVVAPPEGNMALYMRSLESIRRLAPRLIAPGHGPLLHDPSVIIDEYIRHRRQREEQLLNALTEQPATVEELVARIYADVDPRLHGLAGGSVQAQLEKLESEARAHRVGDTWRLFDDRVRGARQ